MKKSLLALAVLGAFAGAASAQSSVTIYGMLDLALAKQIGSEDKEVWDSPNSRIGFRGQEDLGGGLSAVFDFQHRFLADDGTQAAARFWHAISMVGLKGSFGTVGLGRQYNGAWAVQNAIDPWGDDTVAGLRDVGVRASIGGVSQTRLDNSISYFSPNMGGFSVNGTIAEGTEGQPDRPYGFAATYATGPLWLGVGYENPGNEDDNLITLGAKYKIGAFGLAGGYATGSTSDDEDVDSFLLAATWTMGAGELRVGYAQSKIDFNGGGSDKFKKAGLGYHYSLSKRTKVYVDVARGNEPYALDNGGDISEENGYGVGIRHSF